MNYRRLPSALESKDQIRQVIGSRRIGFFLDYDGTLAPIAPRPELADLPPAARSVIERLSRDYMVCLVSGRGLDDLRAKVDLPGVYYAADHGHRIVGPPGSRLEHEVGTESRAAVAAAAAEARRRLLLVPGALVEEKDLSLSIHFRLTPDDRLDFLRSAVDEVRLMFPSLRPTKGKCVIELRPAEEWGKGHALSWLVDRLGWSVSDTCPICIGDDLTDEDLFEEVGDRGVSILVGPSERPTRARYSLADPTQVVAFLAGFARSDD